VQISGNNPPDELIEVAALSAPSPTYLHDSGRFERIRADAREVEEVVKSVQRKSLVPKVLRHQSVIKWA
jgi:hypothetical protein